MKSSPKLSTNLLPRLAIISVIASSLSVAFAAPPVTTGAEFFSAPIQTSPPSQHTSAVLNKIFTTGVGPFDPATMSGKVYPYNLPKNSVFGSPLYNGCYDRKNIRIGPLDPDLSCATTIAANPNTPIYRLFIGYKVDCAEAPDASNICHDTSLLFNCEYKQVNAGSAFFDPSTTTQYCSKGNPIVRRAKAKAEITPAVIGCYPGTDGTTYPICTKCADGYYNTATDPNKQPCTKCSLTDLPASSIQFAGTIKPQTFTTNTASSSQGAISPNQCKIAASDGWNCVSPAYTKTADNQACVEVPQCNLKISTTSSNPTSAGGGSDGSITATYSGQSGTVTTFQITSPSAIAPNASGTFSNLAPNTYTVTVTDSVCTTTANVTLTLVTSPSPTPAPSPTTAPSPTPSASPDPTVSPIPGCDIDPNDPWLIRASCTCAPTYRKTAAANPATGFYACELIPVCNVNVDTPIPGKPVMCTYNCGTEPYGIGFREMFLRTGETCSSADAMARVQSGTRCGNPTPSKCITNRFPEYCTGITCDKGVKVLLHDFNWGTNAYSSVWGIPGFIKVGVCVNTNEMWISWACGTTSTPGLTGGYSPPKPADFPGYPNGNKSDSFKLCPNGYYGYSGVNDEQNGEPACPH